MNSYDFESKKLYRKRRESAIDRMLSSRRFRDRKVAYLDTKEALDTISYLNRGYRPENLWVINRNPAEVAMLTRKLETLGLPRVNTVGLDFEEALERRVPEVDVVDFDGMSCLHPDLIQMLRRITRKRDNCVFGVTLLGGRETVLQPRQYRNIDQTSFGTKTNPNHSQRLQGLFNLLLDDGPGKTEFDDYPCFGHITRIVWDVYTSISRQPMIWSVFNLESHKQLSVDQAVNLGQQIEGFVYPQCKLPGIYTLADKLQEQWEATNSFGSRKAHLRALAIIDAKTQYLHTLIDNCRIFLHQAGKKNGPTQTNTTLV